MCVCYKIAILKCHTHNPYLQFVIVIKFLFINYELKVKRSNS